MCSICRAWNCAIDVAFKIEKVKDGAHMILPYIPVFISESLRDLCYRCFSGGHFFNSGRRILLAFPAVGLLF